MRNFATSISIQASPGIVWALLTDAAGYPSWNTTVRKIDGRIALNEKITVHAKIAPGRAFPLTVTALTHDRGMVWSGGMPLGLFTGTRRFTLSTATNGSVDFSMAEIYAGLLAPLITRSIPDLQPAFDQFALDLKQRAEAVARE